MPTMLPAYSSAQTVGGLVNPGTVEAAGLLADGMPVRAVNDRLVADNLTRTQSSQNRRRLATTTTRHLSHLSPDALAHVAQARPGFELLLWLAIVSEARLFADCARDVVWEALVLAERPFRVADFDEFWRLKALTDPSLAALSAANRNRQRSVFLRCLREAGFIDGAGAPLPLLVPPSVARLVNGAPEPWGWPLREAFPVPQAQFDVLEGEALEQYRMRRSG